MTRPVRLPRLFNSHFWPGEYGGFAKHFPEHQGLSSYSSTVDVFPLLHQFKTLSPGPKSHKVSLQLRFCCLAVEHDQEGKSNRRSRNHDHQHKDLNRHHLHTGIPPMSQFLIPSQVDPDVLEEIRQSIREEAARQKRAQEEGAEAQLLYQHDGPEEAGQRMDDLELDLLPNSQVDADVWKEMSKEDKALYLAMQEEDRQQQQQQRLPPPAPPAQQLLRPAPPQSPRKNRHLPWSKKGPPTPTKRRKAMSAQQQHQQQQQKNRFPPAPTAAAAAEKILDANGIDVSPWLFTTGQVNRPLFETLDAETRQDVISEARKHHTAHLTSQERATREAAALQQRLANAIVLPPLDRQRYLGPERIPVGDIAEIRSMMEGWFAAAKGGQPERRDVDLVSDFLKRLVVVEMNMEKASIACRVFGRIVEEGFREGEEGEGEEGEVDEGWRDVVAELIEAVQEGVRERGYGPLEI